MAMASVKVWSVADLADQPDDGNRYEVIDGELHVTPAPTWEHQRAVMLLYELLVPYVRAEGIGDVLVSPADVVFSDDRGVQPDLFVVPLIEGRRPRSFVEARRLFLAVEVLSPSTAHWDRVKKRALYRDERVPEYWLVDPDARVIERSTPHDLLVEVSSAQLAWRPEKSNTQLMIDVARYFADVLDG